MPSLNALTLTESDVNTAVTDIITALTALTDASDPDPVPVFQSVRRAFSLPLWFEAETVTPSCVVWQRNARYSLANRTNFFLEPGNYFIELYLYLWCPETDAGALDIQAQRERLVRAVLLALRPTNCGGLLSRTNAWQYDGDAQVYVDHTDTMQRHYDARETQRGWYVTRIDVPITVAINC